jgi:hypothetical protein
MGDHPDLQLPDQASVADLGTLVTRARRADAAGAVRLLGHRAVLAAFVCVVGPPGPTVLGLRTLQLAAEAELDVVVPLAAVADRCARLAVEPPARPGPIPFPVPPMQVSVPWAGISPPRQGWQPAGTVGVEALLTAARAGAAEIATGSPEGSGAAAVTRLRGLVWGRPLTAAESEVPSGMAFAADLLGFVRPGDADLPVHRSGRWSRISSARGYLLARPPVTL